MTDLPIPTAAPAPATPTPVPTPRRPLGLIGGMSWESTRLYYEHLNRAVARELGGLHSAPLHLVSLDFAEVAAAQRAGDWDGLARTLGDAAATLEAAGAACVLICTNTMHKIAPQVQARVRVPLLHIADATAAALLQAGVRRVGLMGTRYTMEQPFLAERLAAHGIECLVPTEAQRERIHAIIFDELCQGRVLDASRCALQAIVDDLGARGAQAAVLACTELVLSLGDGVDRADGEGPGRAGALPLFDTTALHAQAAAEFCLGRPMPPEPAPLAPAADTRAALA